MSDPAVRERPSPNHGPRRAAIDMLIIHYTGMKTAEAALDRLCDPASEVSAHYLIEEDGRVWRLVPEDRRAWHAGRGFWAGTTDVNSRSIGIELANPGHEHGYRPFPDAQMTALEHLCRGILTRFPIRSHLVLGHADVAPGRKLDPGELFDWQRLSAAGIGLWPDGAVAEIDDFAADMRRYGYENDSAESVAAFQRHFRPAAVTGIADTETRGRLRNLIIQAGLA
ncbi:MAG TPA: N-acetylmuramoyl-L-alanine amidase [Alphaproteobacteria bacterium]|jgi:N-acetylmuramoyl-L-alanine amidase|nr:N-acetylmuramoyl-L-alanine amidase [Alphaproteobacteria bacterium]